ncbi:hypothetical protein [Streptomyces sp. WAC01526]|uniref:hypothetical protein n=1 Tax=Streptomyces sp. WAC01526 TaxID=2588709 RepID=UPI001651E61B|nr:hypothetical protein [Streptomyces sp. WAC01526]
MGWKQAFDDALKELREARRQLERLDDPTVGLSALHGEITQSRLKIQEAVQAGVTGLREENREVRRRQERMINDLNETRGELRQLLDLADVLRAAALDRADGPGQSDGSPEPSEGACHEPPADSGAQAGHGPEPGPAVTAPHQHTEPGSNQQGETMDNTQRQSRPETGSDDQDLALKNAIEAAYHGTEVPTPASPTAPQASGSRPEDARVTHGVLLLKAAGVASAELVAHRDTWEWLAALAVDHGHFRTPTAVEDIKEGRVQTVLSGRSLIALLIELWSTRSTATPLEADWALATTAYHRIAAELADVAGQGETIRIVLDDGLPHSADD